MLMMLNYVSQLNKFAIESYYKFVLIIFIAGLKSGTSSFAEGYSGQTINLYPPV